MTTLNDISVADRHRAVAANFTELLQGVGDWQAPTPVKEWDVRGIVRHLVEWLPGMLAGGSTVRLTEAPSVDDDPVLAWQHLTGQVQALLDDPATAGITYHSPMFDDMAIPAVIDQFWTPDVFMHSWDLARASGQRINLEPEYAADLLRGLQAMDQAVLRDSGQFGAPRPVPEDGSVVDELVGFIGRDPGWTPPGAVG